MEVAYSLSSVEVINFHIRTVVHPRNLRVGRPAATPARGTGGESVLCKLHGGIYYYRGCSCVDGAAPLRRLREERKSRRPAIEGSKRGKRTLGSADRSSPVVREGCPASRKARGKN